MSIIQVLLLVSFLLICIQDFKQKAVHILLYIVAFLFSVYDSIIQKGISQLLTDSLINTCILIFILGFVSVYYMFKTKKIASPINKLIGSGDIVFFIILSVLFDPLLFVFFISISQIIILLISSLVLVKKKNKETLHIPLAGALALCYIFFNVGTFLYPGKIHEFQNYLISII